MLFLKQKFSLVISGTALIIIVLSFLSAGTVFACETNVPNYLDRFHTPGAPCTDALCNGAAVSGKFWGSTTYRYLSADGINIQTCEQTDYFDNYATCMVGATVSAYTCSSQCNPNLSPQGYGDSKCGGGSNGGGALCANGYLSATQVCDGDSRWKNAPAWCQNYNCGYKCSGAPRYEPIPKSPGDTAPTCNSTSCCEAPTCPLSSDATTTRDCYETSCPAGWETTTDCHCGIPPSGKVACKRRIVTCVGQEGNADLSCHSNSCPAGYFPKSSKVCALGEVCCYPQTCVPNTDLGIAYSCQNGSSCPSGYTRTTQSLTCPSGQTCCYPSGGATCSWQECEGACGGGRGIQECELNGVVTQTRNCTNNNRCPAATPPPPGRIGSCTLLSARSTGNNSGSATVSVNGFNRIDWKLNGRIMSIADIVTVQNGTNSHNFTNLSANTTYHVTATGWCDQSGPNPCNKTSRNCDGNIPPFTTGPPTTSCASPPCNLQCWAPSGCRPGLDYNCDVGRWATGDSGGRRRVSANFNLPGTRGYKIGEGCYRENEIPDPPEYGTLGGKIWVVPACTPVYSTSVPSLMTSNPNTSSTFTQPAVTSPDYHGNMLYWVWSIYGGPMCSFTNGSVCQLRTDNPNGYWANSNQLLGTVGGEEDELYANNSITLVSWDSTRFKPVGYYRYQSASTVGHIGCSAGDTGGECIRSTCVSTDSPEFYYWGGFICDGCGKLPYISDSGAVIPATPITVTNGYYPNEAARYCLVGSDRNPAYGIDNISHNARVDWVLEKLGTYTVTGRVKDTAGASVAGAVVSLSGFGTYTTLANGSYSFSNVPDGSHTMSIQTPEGFLPFNPSTGSLTVSVGCATAANLVVTQDFIVRPTYDIKGFVKYDENSDGCTASDPTRGTVSLEGFTPKQPISLSGDGRYSFDDLSYLSGQSEAYYRVTVNPGVGILPQSKFFTIPPRHISPETDFCIPVPPRPFVETQNGDVHSNTKINLPKGPPILP